MYEGNKKRLGDLLVENGKISRKQLEFALKKQKSSGRRLGQILVEENIIEENDILSTLEMQLGIDRVYLDMVSIDMNAVKSISESLAKKHCLIPILFNEDKLIVAMSDPLNIFAMDDVKIASSHVVEPVLASSRDINEAIEKYYSSQFAEKAAQDLSKQKKETAADKAENSLNFDEIKNAPAVRLVDSIIKNAVKARASDIHIEPFEKYIKIRYRVDGMLQEVLRTSKDTQAALVTRIKIMSNLNIAEKRIPQDGRIISSIDDKEVDLRVSTLPTVYGEKVVIRILNRDTSIIGKNNIGMNQDESTKLDNILKSPYGIILVAGPTGSGKTTTLYSILNDLNKTEKNIVTVEDPVEYMLEGVNQVNVNVKAGLTFASGLRSILRQDPDIVMIGEIRDGETAEIAIRAAITGHLVLSTIHTNDAASSVIRLLDMGIEPYLVATSVTGVISQRLVRKLCPQCKVKYLANNYEKKMLDLPEDSELTLYRGEGCPHCGGTGYIGRTGVYEIMEMSREHREIIMTEKDSEKLKDLAINKGMKTLRQACVEKVIDGITSIDELVKIAFLKE